MANGRVTLNADGTFTVQPTANSTAPITFSYTVSDGSLLATANAQLNVGGTNDTPFAAADTASTDQHTSVNIDVVANDTDVDGDELHVSEIDGHAIAAGKSVTLAGGGSVTLNGDGTITFSPAVTDYGPLVFTYKVADPSGASSVGTVTVGVAAIATEPTILLGDLAGNEDTAISLRSRSRARPATPSRPSFFPASPLDRCCLQERPTAMDVAGRSRSRHRRT